MASSPSPSESNSNESIIAEYAKSNRSTCKKCSNLISVNSLRLGLHFKDRRGYDVTKWHHISCFPTHSLQYIENIQGFSSLKSSDREVLEKLMDGIDLEFKQGSDHGVMVEGSEERSSKKLKVRKVDEHKKEGEQKKSKVIVEYAKSNKSSCKQCTKAIPSKTLRIGLVIRGWGFDMTKWHHLRCLSAVPLPVDSVDEIDGFPSLKSNHQEALKKLLNGEVLPIEVLKEDEAALDELQESKSKTSKPSIKILTEYAKSSHSSCKKCTEAIPANSVRVGSHSPEYGIRWYHPVCFPTDSQPIISLDKIDGFSSLKSFDQKTLQKVLDGCDKLPKEAGKADEHEKEGEQKKSKVIAEYAKSNRSSCKQCTKEIPSKTLRSGLVSRGWGFDMTRWHHLRCLSTVPLPVDSVDEIDGFPSLKVLKEDEAALDELQESKSKTSKISIKIVTGYAKSSRSSCKKCSEAIADKSLRVGSLSNERGRDFTRWYHPDCFPTDSQPIISLDEIDGFSSLKSCDQEVLQKLMDGCNKLLKEVVPVVEGSDDQSLRESKVRNYACKVLCIIGVNWFFDLHLPYFYAIKVRERDESMLDELKESSPKKLKVAELEVAFSTSDVKKHYKDATLPPNWKALQTLIFLERDEGLRDSGKIAAFGFDGCLADTDVHRIGADAWSLMSPSIPEKLKSLYKDGYKLVIFTNESNIDRWKNKRQVAIDSKIGRLQKFIDCVKVPIQVFIACGIENGGKGEDPFRKPKPGMWRVMEQQFNSGISIDMDQSFYVGDAAGRKKDHSDADIKFAESRLAMLCLQAIGLKFYVPEEFFAA
ncbi:hypothetical protein C5167_047772 [Papaver somniferum]|uniref:PARP-type domain-containing protein n=1 Tax=Papaver somniferum TaxID=3469 RepID=A0A4Y7LJ60_PAPSO|nr:hypothetical protein C5167_047772 [Papaver somniferum]